MRITGTEAVRIKHDVDEMHDKTAHIYAPTETRASNGGVIETYPANPTATSPCQIAPMGNDIEQFYSDRLGGRQGWIVSLRETVRVSLVSRVHVDGRTYEVIGSDIGRTNQWRQRLPVRELT